MATLDNFSLSEQPIGRGAYCDAYLSEDPKTGEKVAVKLITDKMMKVSRNIERAESEFGLQRSLEHPNVAKLHTWSSSGILKNKEGTIQATNKLYATIEYCSNGELFEQIINRGSFTEETARHYFGQLLDGLTYLHSSGIAHRDLKPENLFIDNIGNLKIADFGFATSRRRSKEYVGTSKYMTPECLARKDYDCKQSDLWAAGLVLFVMVTGMFPFNLASPEDDKYCAFRTQQEDYWTFIETLTTDYHQKTLSPEFKDLISKLLHSDESKRASLSQIREHPWIQGGTSCGVPTWSIDLVRAELKLPQVEGQEKIRDTNTDVSMSTNTSHQSTISQEEETSDYEEAICLEKAKINHVKELYHQSHNSQDTNDSPEKHRQPMVLHTWLSQDEMTE